EEKRLAEERKIAAEKKAAEEKRTADEKKAAEGKKSKAKRMADEERKKQETQATAKAEAKRKRGKAVSNAHALIAAKVNRLWRRPPSTPKGLSCLIAVKTVPGGEVVSAQVIGTSGNAAFDRSAERAVFQASPLPVPDDPELYSQFRNFNLRFRPGS
ncbi:MAG: TonB C-terminal domain-containing protein, partial [Methylococcales bacterium]